MNVSVYSQTALKGGTNEIRLVFVLFCFLSLTFVVSSTRNQYSVLEAYLENYHFSESAEKVFQFALWDIVLVT